MFERPEGMVELIADPGDAVLFDRRLWHPASTNRSATTRVLLTYGYSHRCLRSRAPRVSASAPHAVG